MRVSIVISERGEPHNLIWTLQGLENEFNGIIEDREYIVVVNGPEDENPFKEENQESSYHWLMKKWPFVSGRLKFFYNSPGGIYQARNLGAEKAKGETLWFLDAHTLPVHGHYIKALEFKEQFRGVMHLGLEYFLDKPGKAVYGYRWNNDRFWGSWTRTKPKPPEYRILMNGGANILIDKNIWFEIGGYNPGLGIYGGGEPYTDLKAQMYGYAVKSHPDLRYYHLAIKRGYHWNQLDFWKNFMITSYALGGEKYFDKVYGSYYEKCKSNEEWLETLNETRDLALSYAKPDYEKTMREAKYTVDEVLDNWREYAIKYGHDDG